MILVFWSVTSDAREHLSSTGRSRVNDGVMNGSIAEPAGVTPVQTLRPRCRRTQADLRELKQLKTTYVDSLDVRYL